MKLEGDNSFLELDRSKLGQLHTPSDEDVLLNVTARCAGYSAADQAWVVGRDLDRFVTELRNLEARRQGQATLAGASPDDLKLEFYSSDSLGHMAVRGHLGWNHPHGFLLQLQFGFNFEPDRLPALLRYFETIRQ
jgi:hypothetical protein